MTTFAIHEHDALGVYTGRSSTSDKWRGVPPGWSKVPLPEIPPGKFAVLTGREWSIVDERPVLSAPVPPVVSRAQGRIALHRAGLLDTVESTVYAPGADPELRIAYEAGEWHRYSQMLLALATGLGLTEEQVDDLFRTAAEVLL